MREEHQKCSPGRPIKESSNGKEQLLKAALKIFTLCSFEKASIRDIANEAKVDVALISYHYGSKYELWKSVVEYILNSAKEELEKLEKLTISIQNTDNLRSNLVLMFEMLVDICTLTPEIGIFVTRESVQTGEKTDYIIDKVVEPFHHSIIGLICKGIEEGIIAKQDPEIFFAMLVNSVIIQLATPNLLLRFSNLPQHMESWTKEIKHSLVVNFLHQ
jgi:TetR/AcrR family transcriptional regulator